MKRLTQVIFFFLFTLLPSVSIFGASSKQIIVNIWERYETEDPFFPVNSRLKGTRGGFENLNLGNQVMVTDQIYIQPSGPWELRDLNDLSKSIQAESLPGLDLWPIDDPLTDEYLAPFSTAVKLKVLILGHNDFTDEGLRNLKDLKDLEVLRLEENRRITGAGLAHLGELTKLKELDLSFTGVENNGLANVTRFKELRRLNLGMSKISGTGLKHLSGLGKLELLKLFNTSITDSGLEHLNALVSLKALDLHDTKITDNNFLAINALPSLEALDLTNSGIGDAGLRNLPNFKNLQVLKLGYTAITDQSLQIIEKLSWIKNIEDLCGTKITQKAIDTFNKKTGRKIRVDCTPPEGWEP